MPWLKFYKNESSKIYFTVNKNKTTRIIYPQKRNACKARNKRSTTRSKRARARARLQPRAGKFKVPAAGRWITTVINAPGRTFNFCALPPGISGCAFGTGLTPSRVHTRVISQSSANTRSREPLWISFMRTLGSMNLRNIAAASALLLLFFVLLLILLFA